MDAKSLKKYTDYIRNASAGAPLPIADFDDDWSPIGPTVRRDLKAAGLIDESDGHLILLSQE